MTRKFLISFPQILLIAAVAMLASAVTVLAATGTTDSPSAPGSTDSYTLEDIYQRLAAGTAGSQSSFTEPSVAPGTDSMHDLNDIMGAAPVLDNTDGATAANVLSGKTFWGLTNGEWGLQIGSIATGSSVNGTDGEKTFNIPDGYYSGETATCNDTQLTAENIKKDVDILGITGTLYGSTTTSGSVNGADGEKTFNIPDGYYSGETATCNDTQLTAENIKENINILGITGSFTGGCTCSGTMNGTRWCDNGDGTVTDMLGYDEYGGKCLVWLKDAGCTGNIDWFDAQSQAGVLKDGSTIFNGSDCGLSDDSNYGNWRLPTGLELFTLFNGTEGVSAINQRAFTNVEQTYYWTSTTASDDYTKAIIFGLSSGGGNYSEHWDKTWDFDSNHAWPVRAVNP